MIKMDNQIQHLNNVIECLQEQDERLPMQKKTSHEITNLYQNTNHILKGFDEHIHRCKKYNQAKIHRKYQIIVNDLAEENQNLKEKLKLETSARPSSQKYVSDLIEKMVALQKNNEILFQQNQKLKIQLTKIRFNVQKIKPLDTKQVKKQSQNQEQVLKTKEKQMIKTTLLQYYEEKCNQKQKQFTAYSMQKIIQSNKSKIGSVTLRELLECIDRWLLKCNENLSSNRIKMKEKVFSSFIQKVERNQSPSQMQLKDQSTSSRVLTNYSHAMDSLTKRNNKIMIKYAHKIRGDTFRLQPISKSQKKIQMSQFY